MMISTILRQSKDLVHCSLRLTVGDAFAIPPVVDQRAPWPWRFRMITSRSNSPPKVASTFMCSPERRAVGLSSSLAAVVARQHGSDAGGQTLYQALHHMFQARKRVTALLGA
jgi:hypothetical protein